MNTLDGALRYSWAMAVVAASKATPSGGVTGLPCEETGAVGALVMDAAWNAGRIVEQGGNN